MTPGATTAAPAAARTHQTGKDEQTAEGQVEVREPDGERRARLGHGHGGGDGEALAAITAARRDVVAVVAVQGVEGSRAARCPAVQGVDARDAGELGPEEPGGAGEAGEGEGGGGARGVLGARVGEGQQVRHRGDGGQGQEEESELRVGGVVLCGQRGDDVFLLRLVERQGRGAAAAAVVVFGRVGKGAAEAGAGRGGVHFWRW